MLPKTGANNMELEHGTAVGSIAASTTSTVLSENPAVAPVNKPKEASEAGKIKSASAAKKTEEKAVPKTESHSKHCIPAKETATAHKETGSDDKKNAKPKSKERITPTNNKNELARKNSDTKQKPKSNEH